MGKNKEKDEVDFKLTQDEMMIIKNYVESVDDLTKKLVEICRKNTNDINELRVEIELLRCGIGKIPEC